MRIVGIGASAGGIEALREFLEHLSPRTGAAFVIVQHLAPDFKSIMDDLLQKFTKMPIKILEKDEVVSPNHIYVMPGDKMVTYHQGVLKLHPRKPTKGLNLPIDRFLHTLGNDLKKEAIAIILSGSGTDGSRGARTVKEQGGMVLVQTPDSAKFDGMPNALIRLDIADSILSPPELALKVAQILLIAKRQRYHPGKEEAIKDDPELQWFKKVLDRVNQLSGIRFGDYKMATLYRRMEKRMALQNLGTLKEYDQLLDNDEEEIGALFRDFLINVTRFFRDPEVFQYLSERVLPKVFANLDPSQVCRVWVPACSTGEEAFTIAILIAEYLRENELTHDFKIFASDVSKKSIAFATRGVYNISISSDIPEDLLVRYFNHHGDEYEIKQNIREKVIFALHNVINDPPFIRMQLVSCRNFLIYLKTGTQDRVLRTFYFALQADAFMLLGPSETIGDLKNVFNRTDRSINIYQKREVDYMKVRQQYKPPSNLWVGEKQRSVQFVNRQQPPMQKFSDDYHDPFSNFLLDRFSPSVVFVDEGLNVLYLNGDVARYLHLPRALAKLNIEKMMDKNNSLLFRDGVRLALKSEDIHRYKNVEFSHRGEELLAQLSFQQLKLEALDETVVMIKFESQNERQEEGTAQDVKEVNVRETDLINEKVLRLEKELRAKKREIEDLSERMEMTTEELNTSNRELMASNEELQSTNEELQSVNEELHTVNAELQYKNEELTVSSNDISNLLRSTNIGTIFLDPELRIRKFTPAIRQQFDLIRSDINRPITAFANNLKGVDLEKICHQVYQTLEPFEQQVEDKNNHAFLLRVLPYHTEQDEVGGCVLTLVDINEIIKVKEEKLRLATKFKALLETTDIPILFVEKTGRVKQVNQRLGDHSVAQLKGKDLFEILPSPKGKELKAVVDQVFEKGKNQTLQLTLPNQKSDLSYHYQFKIIPIRRDPQQEEVSLVIIAAFENTKAFQQQRAMEETKEIYRSFMRHAQHQIALINKEGVIVDLNYAQHSGKETNELIGSKIYDLIPPSEVKRYKASVQQVFKGESKSKITFKYVNKNGVDMNVTLIATPVVVNNKVAFVALIGDPIEG